MRPPPVADKGSKALSEIMSNRKHIYVQRIATIFQTGVHWAPALMKLFVLCVCYDVIKIVYSNVVANRVRQSFRLQNQNEQTHNLFVSKIIMSN